MPQRTDSKPLRGKEKREGLSPRRSIPLDTLGNVRTEMARLYRLALKGTVVPEEMTKFIYALKEIRGCIEAETVPAAIADIQRRLDVISSAGARRG